MLLVWTEEPDDHLEEAKTHRHQSTDGMHEGRLVVMAKIKSAWKQRRATHGGEGPVGCVEGKKNSGD
jgi:hypothetical protein